jgi:hypothetical protein
VEHRVDDLTKVAKGVGVMGGAETEADFLTAIDVQTYRGRIEVSNTARALGTLQRSGVCSARAGRKDAPSRFTSPGKNSMRTGRTHPCFLMIGLTI